MKKKNTNEEKNTNAENIMRKNRKLYEEKPQMKKNLYEEKPQMNEKKPTNEE